jgi:hypothetical protein
MLQRWDRECAFCGFAARRARRMVGGRGLLQAVIASASEAIHGAKKDWIASSLALLAMTTGALPPKIKRRARGPPLCKDQSDRTGSPGGASAPPGLVGYFFFDFLAFLAFFAFFAFLAIASSFGLMDGNATRGMLGGGPTSQHPQMQSQQIRGPLPRTVTQASSRYPQLLCVLTRFRRPRCAPRLQIFQVRGRERSQRRPPARVNDAPTRRCILSRSRAAARNLHHFKTTASIASPGVRVR